MNGLGCRLQPRETLGRQNELRVARRQNRASSSNGAEMPISSRSAQLLRREGPTKTGIDLRRCTRSYT